MFSSLEPLGVELPPGPLRHGRAAAGLVGGHERAGELRLAPALLQAVGVERAPLSGRKVSGRAGEEAEEQEC